LHTTSHTEQISFIGDSITWLQIDNGEIFGCECLFSYSVFPNHNQNFLIFAR
jgi:hypothetical protein